jgi:hypothetical protein
MAWLSYRSLSDHIIVCRCEEEHTSMGRVLKAVVEEGESRAMA